MYFFQLVDSKIATPASGYRSIGGETNDVQPSCSYQFPSFTRNLGLRSNTRQENVGTIDLKRKVCLKPDPGISFSSLTVVEVWDSEDEKEEENKKRTERNEKKKRSVWPVEIITLDSD